MHALPIFIAASLAMTSTTVAHANHDLSRRARLAEVSADPRDGADTIELHDLRRFTHLELRAREDLVDIHGLGIRFADGHTRWMNIHTHIAPGEQRTIELPYDVRRAEAVIMDYGDPEHRRRDRTPARLELYGAVLDGRQPRHADRWEPRHADRREPRHADRREPRHPDRREPRHADRWERRDALSLRSGCEAPPRVSVREHRVTRR